MKVAEECRGVGLLADEPEELEAIIRHITITS